MTRRWPPEAHVWRCRTCNVEMSTDNLTPDLAAIWDAFHAGHAAEEEHPLPEITAPETRSPTDEYLARMAEL